MLSINSDDQTRYVDVFARADGSYGFEEFRRDPEDPGGWYPIGGYSQGNYPSQNQALAEARVRIIWFPVRYP
jgi:hypothetical protein